VPVRLQPQPAQVLKTLIAARGQLVSRESIRQAVWGSEVHVDFDKALNYAISQVRSALRDSADSPRYIETLPKSGYRFIAPLEPGSAAPTVTKPKTYNWVRRREFAIGAGVASIGAAFGLWRLVTVRGEQRIAIALFDNETGDAALDRYANDVTDSLVVALTEKTMGRYGIIGNASVLRGSRSFRDLATIAQELRAQIVILGQIKADDASRFVLAHLIRMPDETHLQVARLPLGKPESDAAEICKSFLPALGSQ
jgi:TolB-like protein